ncbi:MAG: NAD(P)/FAD-dependent oxidoreductase [Bacteroidota bacterium]|nr:NAD(P)/FAD-dependent oxidoreductase [Bacteroidota bacterium]
MSARKKIIIIGAGFGGLNLAQKLNNTNYDVLLIDKHNYHQFQPLMYQVATARLEPTSISFPLRKVFQKSKNVRIRITEVLSVNTNQKTISTSLGTYSYDYLVISFGCTSNYFGNANIEKYAYPMKSIPESLQLRNHILQNFEDVLVAKDADLEALLNFVIVGGGPTGVELAGALAEMKKNVLPKDYPEKDFSKLNVYLIEGSANTLNVMSDLAKKTSRKYLEELGVKVITQMYVSDYDGNVVTLKSGEQIKSKNLIWAAGVIGNKLDGIPQEVISRGNRLLVNRYNQIQDLDGVYALGDIAAMATPKYPNGHPQLASVALTQAENMAKNFKNMLIGKPLSAYEYHDKGSMATVGKRKAIVDLPKFSFKGRFAWFFWMFLHLMLILSVKNKLSIFVNWMMSYFYNDSTLRVILHPKFKVKD